MKILFSFYPKRDQQTRLIENFPQAEFIFQKPLDEEALKTADILVTYGEDLHASHLEKADQLKWIMVASAGLEKMPLDEIAARNIILTNARGIHKIPMAESILAHILSIKKSLPLMAKNQRNGEWSPKLNPTELFGSTALILGTGAIGSEVGRILQAFGVHTIGCNRSGKMASSMDTIVSFGQLKEVLPDADIVISILPSTEETKHLLTYEHFQCMKPSAIFMNFGRGDVIKEEELLRALTEERIAYAVLDVFEKEPLHKEHPFWKMHNVIVSPHASSHSSQYVVRALEIFSENLTEWLNESNQLENIIDLKRGY
ncbi:D-2-hydroxyacid dehydrogenase [Psychrobacillus lasiicapitis]|uniref:D-2-hydroxyacid dehydrogenase n=1 Tax=Psychrobacillus lasiicapitis TaxID=1636719 RepID=A0A544SYC8_9BACI|nr:D-2-hydroxyacid dehydrogenase [Psychrobacillus lasiicapitis]TQR10159.1 D-2-hydroxyacid dehydrogenase [Psychrobacillus lasiicapitis]GGA45877.1 glycerate dehydrogenase [Psychrobacillus lasiicapitis]